MSVNKNIDSQQYKQTLKSVFPTQFEPGEVDSTCELAVGAWSRKNPGLIEILINPNNPNTGRLLMKQSAGGW